MGGAKGMPRLKRRFWLLEDRHGLIFEERLLARGLVYSARD